MNGIVTTQVYWLVKNNDKITWWFIPRIVSGLIHPSYKWTTCPHLSHENHQGELTHKNDPWVVHHQVMIITNWWDD